MCELLFDIEVEVFDSYGTDKIGRILAEFLPSCAVVSLSGTFGAGKTRLVQGTAKFLGIEMGEVISPTFVLIREYEGKRWIYHFDIYRLESELEFRQLDPDDYFEREGITFIEWGDKFPQILPKERLEIRIEITGEESRLFRFVAFGKIFNKTIETLVKFKNNVKSKE
jgi:tRNA threonylcarbamoyladenosine biosynthesis protein TsaE